MTDDRTAAVNEALCREVEAMFGDGTAEGMVASLRSRFPRFGAVAEDAVAHAVEKIIV